MKKLLFIVAACLVALNLGHGETNNVLDLKPGDVQLVQVELKPNEMPKLVIYFSKAKLMEAQKLIGSNYDQRIKIVTGGKLVAEPRIQSQLLYKRKMITLGFPTADDALDAAKLLVPNY